MITLDALREFGADTEKGLAMCMGNEALYLRLAGSVPAEQSFDAHALKGVLGNLSLTPLYEKASQITELLRSRTDTDYKPLLEELAALRDALAKICE